MVTMAQGITLDVNILRSRLHDSEPLASEGVDAGVRPVLPVCADCGLHEDEPIHDMRDVNDHEFNPRAERTPTSSPSEPAMSDRERWALMASRRAAAEEALHPVAASDWRSLADYLRAPPQGGSVNETPDFGETPRRIRMDLWTPAERAIYDAIQAVEEAGADERLTDAVILLGRAKDRVADYVDGIVPGSMVFGHKEDE